MTKTISIALVVVLALLVLPRPASAQVGSDDPCDPSDVLFSLPDPEEISGDPPDMVWSLLRSVAGVILRADARCKGLFWQDAGNKLLGPFEIPAGFYRVTGEGMGKLRGYLTAMEGECGNVVMVDYFSPLIFNDMDASRGLEALLTSKGCTAVMEVESNTSWSIVFEQVGELPAGK